jgi:hypothetical protein
MNLRCAGHLEAGSSARRQTAADLSRGSPGLNLSGPTLNSLMNASRSLTSSKANRLRLPDANIKRVLVPVDFSACTLDTLCYAAALARPFDAVVDVLHVIQPNLRQVSLLG